ncbi:DUF1456 family protein [Petrocella sp. FN5]|nr:DUF1456 family protein [Petrocella sp. FN5]MDF1618467.1 DUF1456 family protein [Petrocella sp. FN5]
MDNNDILIRVRYALDIKNTEMIDIFKFGGIEFTKEEVLKLLTRSKDSYYDEVESHDATSEATEDAHIKCNHKMLEAFFNGLIIFKRGRQEGTEQGKKPILAMKDSGSVNNVMLKKLKIALALSSDDVMEIFELAGETIGKAELGALFRKEGHKHYRECGDKYARRFLKGLSLKYRDDLE